jgi:hypothetical protein
MYLGVLLGAVLGDTHDLLTRGSLVRGPLTGMLMLGAAFIGSIIAFLTLRPRHRRASRKAMRSVDGRRNGA